MLRKEEKKKKKNQRFLIEIRRIFLIKNKNIICNHKKVRRRVVGEGDCEEGGGGGR